MTPPARPPDRSNSQAAILAVGIGVVVLAAALLYAWHVERENARLRAAAPPVVVQVRAPVQYAAQDDTVRPVRDSRPSPDSPAAAAAAACARAERLAGDGEFLLALRELETTPGDPAVSLRTEIGVLIEAACEEAERRAAEDPVRGLDLLADLAGRVPEAAADRLNARRQALAAGAAREAAEKRLGEADGLLAAGKVEEGILALIEASRLLPGDAREAALDKAALWVRRARYEGMLPAAELAALAPADLDRVERAVEACLAASDEGSFTRALAEVVRLPQARPALVRAVILRGGTPLDAPTGDRIVTHALPGGAQRVYGVSVPETGLPTRPRPLLLMLQPGAGPPEAARGVARSWRQTLGGDLIVAVAVPDDTAGWGPNRLGESQVPELLRHLRSQWLFDPDRVVITGLSAGAHGAWFQAMRHGDLFSSVVGVAGTPYAPLYGHHWLDWISNLTLCPSRAFVGARDAVFPVSHARTFARLAAERGARVDVVESPAAGHEGASWEDEKKALAQALALRRDPWPASLSWSTDSLATARCAWIEVAAFPEGTPDMTLNFVDENGASLEKRRVLRECARVEASVAGQEIRVTATRVARLRLHLGQGLLDLAREFRVVVNGREAFRGTARPEVETELREARASLRRDRVSEAVIEVVVE